VDPIKFMGNPAMRKSFDAFLQFHDISVTSPKSVSIIIKIELKLFGKFSGWLIILRNVCLMRIE
jgi:hypothetical protein